MTKMNDPRTIADYLHCLSVLEDNTSLLYKNLSEKAEMPLVKTFLLSIAQDSSKHSALLKGMTDSISASKEKAKNCKKLGETWRVIDTALKEITSKEKIGRLELERFIEKLTVLESSVGEEYYILLQMKTLQYMAKEINQLYNINLERTKSIFTNIIEDEERHRELLATIKDLLSPDKPQKQEKAPEIKYQNPDAWIRQLPPNNP